MSNELYNSIARVTDGIYEGWIFIDWALSLLLFMTYVTFCEVKSHLALIMTFIGIAIGGDVFPGSTLSDHVLRFNNIPQVHKLIFC